MMTSEEKIDYIYNTLKRNQKWKVFGIVSKWIFRGAVLAYTYYFITIGLPLMIDNIIPRIPTIPSIDGKISIINDPEKIKELLKIPEFKNFLKSYQK